MYRHQTEIENGPFFAYRAERRIVEYISGAFQTDPGLVSHSLKNIKNSCSKIISEKGLDGVDRTTAINNPARLSNEEELLVSVRLAMVYLSITRGPGRDQYTDLRDLMHDIKDKTVEIHGEDTITYNHPYVEELVLDLYKYHGYNYEGPDHIIELNHDLFNMFSNTD